MFKKILLSAYIIATSTNIALASNSIHRFQSGAYGGAALGLSVIHSKNNETMKAGPARGVYRAEHSTSSTKVNYGIGGDLFFGYRHIFDNGFLTGLDLAFSLDNNKSRHKHSFDFNGFEEKSYTILKSNYKIIPGLLVGSRFQERFLAFLKLGVSFSEFKIDHRSKYTDFPGFQPNPEINKGSKSRKAGLYSSAALEMAVNERFSTIGLISYEYYGKIRKTIDNTVNTRAGLAYTSHDVTLKPNVLTFKVGLIYRLPSTF